MDVYINQLKRIIDRIIMPQFPEIDSYEIDIKEQSGWHYMGVIYVPKQIKKFNDWENLEEDKWKDIDEKFDKFNEEWYEKFEDELSFTEKLTVAKYNAEYKIYKYVP